MKFKKQLRQNNKDICDNMLLAPEMIAKKLYLFGYILTYVNTNTPNFIQCNFILPWPAMCFALAAFFIFCKIVRSESKAC